MTTQLKLTYPNDNMEDTSSSILNTRHSRSLEIDFLVNFSKRDLKLDQLNHSVSRLEREVQFPRKFANKTSQFNLGIQSSVNGLNREIQIIRKQIAFYEIQVDILQNQTNELSNRSIFSTANVIAFLSLIVAMIALLIKLL